MKSGLLSIILLSYYSDKRIRDVYYKTKDIMDQEEISFEFIIMDDGSKDNSFQIALDLEKKEESVRAFQLSKNYTSHYSKFAGFSVCSGDCATSMPDDFQIPPELIVKEYRLWQQGNKIVIPYRKSRRDGRIKDFFSNSYYHIMNSISDVNFPPGGADNFFVDREIIDILNKRIHPINTSSIVEVLRLGFEPFFLPFDRPETKSKSRWTFKKRYKLGKDTIYSSSSFPIRFISYLGILSFLFSMFLIFLASYLKLTGRTSIAGVSIPGWTSTVAILSLFSGFILLSLGIIAEYIWKIHEEVKNRPGYIIKNKSDEF